MLLTRWWHWTTTIYDKMSKSIDRTTAALAGTWLHGRHWSQVKLTHSGWIPAVDGPATKQSWRPKVPSHYNVLSVKDAAAGRNNFRDVAETTLWRKKTHDDNWRPLDVSLPLCHVGDGCWHTRRSSHIQSIAAYLHICTHIHTHTHSLVQCFPRCRQRCIRMPRPNLI